MDMQLKMALVALPLVAWFAWDAYRWLRVASRGSWQCEGREVRPGQAAVLGAAKAVAAAGVVASVLVYGAGAPDAVVIFGPLLMILLSYVAEREVKRRFRPLPPEHGEELA